MGNGGTAPVSNGTGKRKPELEPEE